MKRTRSLRSEGLGGTTEGTNYYVFHCRGGDAESAIMAAGPYNYSYIFKYIIIGDMGVESHVSFISSQKKSVRTVYFVHVLSFHF